MLCIQAYTFVAIAKDLNQNGQLAVEHLKKTVGWKMWLASDSYRESYELAYYLIDLGAPYEFAGIINADGTTGPLPDH